MKKVGVRHGWEDGARLHMLAASLGEVTACLVRVPVEIVKQRRQASSQSKSLEIVRSTLRSEGVLGLLVEAPDPGDEGLPARARHGDAQHQLQEPAMSQYSSVQCTVYSTMSQCVIR